MIDTVFGAVDETSIAIILLPYKEDGEPLSVRYWVVSRGEEIPKEAKKFMINLLYEEELYKYPDLTLQEYRRDANFGDVTILMLPSKGVGWDKDHDQDELCNCGHTYLRHFDGYDGMAPVRCKYCSCSTFEADPDKGTKKHPNEICSRCYGLLNANGTTCAKCGEDVEPYRPSQDV